MFVDYVWYVVIGISLAAVFTGALLLNVRYERGRRRLEAQLTPEERKERDVRANVVKRGLWPS
jgi:hypothetical protein